MEFETEVLDPCVGVLLAILEGTDHAEEFVRVFAKIKRFLVGVLGAARALFVEFRGAGLLADGDWVVLVGARVGLDVGGHVFEKRDQRGVTVLFRFFGRR